MSEGLLQCQMETFENQYRILPLAAVKMVDKSRINETYSLMIFSTLSLSLSLLHDSKSICVRKSCKMLSRMVLDAPENIETRLEGQKIVGITNLQVYT
jgi:hypothetical protein